MSGGRREWVGACVRELVEGSCYDGTLPPASKGTKPLRQADKVVCITCQPLARCAGQLSLFIHTNLLLRRARARYFENGVAVPHLSSQTEREISAAARAPTAAPTRSWRLAQRDASSVPAELMPHLSCHAASTVALPS